MLGRPRILSLSPTRLINSIKHDQSCKILYLFCSMFSDYKKGSNAVASYTKVYDNVLQHQLNIDTVASRKFEVLGTRDFISKYQKFEF